MTTTLPDTRLLQRRLDRPVGEHRVAGAVLGVPPKVAMVRTVAVGPEPTGPDTLELAPVSVWLEPRAGAPCGSTRSTAAADLLASARMHLMDGEGPAGRALPSARTMREPQRPQPDHGRTRAPARVGVRAGGPARLADPLVVEHGGNIRSQQSELAVVPERGRALCVLPRL